MAALGVSAACSRSHVVTNGSQCDSAPVSRMLNRMLTVRKWLSTPSTRCAAQSLTACRDCTGSTLTSCHHQPWPSCMASSPTPSCWPSWAPSTPSCGRSTGLVRACVLHACMVACVCAGRLPPCSWQAHEVQVWSTCAHLPTTAAGIDWDAWVVSRLQQASVLPPPRDTTGQQHQQQEVQQQQPPQLAGTLPETPSPARRAAQAAASLRLRRARSIAGAAPPPPSQHPEAHHHTPIAPRPPNQLAFSCPPQPPVPQPDGCVAWLAALQCTLSNGVLACKMWMPQSPPMPQSLTTC